MYLTHFGLRELPFGITPDTSYFFWQKQSQEALNTLLIAARSGEGIIKITGEVGTGKTLLCRKFMVTLEDSFVIAYIPNPLLEPRALMMALAEDLGVEVEHGIEQHHLLKALNQRLLVLARERKRVLVCLDEAQAIPVESLEALRLLSNLETEKRKLLQIVLFGQPELDTKLNNPAIRQLTQRITFHYELKPLGRDDLEYYVLHRLRVAGYDGARLFSKNAIRLLGKISGGTPRLVNILAHKALMQAYGEGKNRIAGRHIRSAADDTIATGKKQLWRWLWRTLPVLALMAGTTAAWAYFK